MMQKFIEAGYEIVDFEAKAEIYVINTCTVTNIADKKSRQMLRRVKQQNKDAILVAVGCYVQVAREKLEEIEDIDLILGTKEKKDIVEYVERYLVEKEKINMKKGNGIALLPIGVFLVLYLGLGILFEYVLKIPMGFYNVPIVVAFLAAILVACLQNRALDFDKKLEIMAQGVGDKNIITMLLIFLAAGSFVGVVGRSSAESVAYCMLSLIPARFSVSVLFIVACFVSVAMGTSVGTITLLTPIAAAVSTASGFDLAFCVASVMGGAMFGDNLSFISDTTIAACNGQGCEMKDKFRENFWIALPAAVATLILILILSFQTEIQGRVLQPYHLTQVIPYVLVLIGGIVGINVFVVLLTGIVSGAFIMLIGGHTTPVEILKNMGSGVSGMFETCMVAILVAAMCALIREYGGFDALLSWIHKIFRGKKGGQLGMGLLVGTMDIATANNTVAIVMANPIAKEMAEEYGITPRKTASILDTFSCVFQGVIPYGAQMLVAISAVNELGGEISAFQIMPKLFYPMLLLLSSLITIMRGSDRTGASKSK
mgnify:CR=1 FL=1